MPKRAWSSGSASPSLGHGRLRNATKVTQKRPRVLSPNGKDFGSRIKRKTTIVISDDEAPDSAQPETPIISDSESDDSSLPAEWSPRGKSRAERLAKVYDQGEPNFDDSDIEIEHDKTTESSQTSGENNHRSYPIRCLAARKDELEDELGKTKQVIEQSKTRELELVGQLAEISQAIEALSNQAAISSNL